MGSKEFCLFPCLTWVRQGLSQRIPRKVHLDSQELQKVIKDTKGRVKDMEVTQNFSDEKNKKKKDINVDVKEDSDDDIIKKYGLDDYDEDHLYDDTSNAAYSMGSLAYHSPDERDPYMVADDEVESDEDDIEVKATDNLLVVGMTDNDASLLYIYVYDASRNHLYVHHEVILPAYPLCLEWLDYDVSDATRAGNYVAVGSMEPTIDIWDLDVIDSLDPTITLGKRLKRKKKSTGCGHSDAVLGLSWNGLSRQHLASASADSSVGVWDVSQAQMVRSVRSHTDKVQCLKWNNVHSHYLVSGSFDRTVRLHDGRQPSADSFTWTLDGEIERVLWDVRDPSCLYASTDQGTLAYIDTRLDTPIYALKAHDSPLIGLCSSGEVNDMLVTASSSGVVKVWDVSRESPVLVTDTSMDATELHCMELNPDVPFVLVSAGSQMPRVWDARKDPKVHQRFLSRESRHNTVEKPRKLSNSRADQPREVATKSLQDSSQLTKKRKKKKKGKSVV